MGASIFGITAGWKYADRRFWLRDEITGSCLPWSRSDLKQHLRVTANVTSREAKHILDGVASRAAPVDAELAQTIAWDRWTGGFRRSVFITHVLFTPDSRAGKPRRMTIRQYNAHVQRHFPGKTTVSEGFIGHLID